MRSQPGEPRRDEGFTLIEVMVSLAVLSIAMAGIGSFFVNGSQAVTQQRDHRQASQVASSAIEQVRALQGSALTQGRGKDAVAAQVQYARTQSPFKARLAPYLDSMNVEAYDTAANVGATDGANAPLSTQPQQVVQSGVTFQQTIYVGECDVYYLWTDSCVNPVTATKKPKDATEILQYFRVVVLVSWQHKNCTANQCGYLASTLVSRLSGEPEFDFKRAAPSIRDPEAQVYYLGRSDVSYQFKATGGVLPNTWTATGLPAGLVMANDGTISGTPTTLGVRSSTVRVTESIANPGDIARYDTRAVDFTVVNPPTIKVTPAAPASLPNSAVNLALAFSDGVGPYTGTVVSGLPGTLKFTQTGPTSGTVTGTVGTAGYTAVLQIEDANRVKTQVSYTHTVVAPLTIGDVPNVAFELGSPVDVTAVAAGGDGKYTYTATGLPAGVTINPTTGVVSGRPLVPGRYLATVSVKDGLGTEVSDSFELLLTTTTALNFTSPAPGQEVTSTVGQPVNLPVATNADAVDAKGTRMTAVGLPPGTRFNNGQDAIVGTPTTPGTYLVTMTATSALPPSTALFTFIWTVS